MIPRPPRATRTDTLFPYTTLFRSAVTAAHAAAAILQAYSHNRAELIIDKKNRTDLVSQADREAEQAVIEILRERTPDLGIVAEESGGQTSGAAPWDIDPLDATPNVRSERRRLGKECGRRWILRGAPYP